MPQVSHVGPVTGASTSSASSRPTAFAAAAFFCGSTRYFLAQSSHKWTSSKRSSPSTSVMCRVACFGHRWHFITGPFALARRAQQCPSGGGCAVHSNSRCRTCHCHPPKASGGREPPVCFAMQLCMQSKQGAHAPRSPEGLLRFEQLLHVFLDRGDVAVAVDDLAVLARDDHMRRGHDPVARRQRAGV